MCIGLGQWTGSCVQPTAEASRQWVTGSEQTLTLLFGKPVVQVWQVYKTAGAVSVVVFVLLAWLEGDASLHCLGILLRTGKRNSCS